MPAAPSTSAYVPGVCNINYAEIKRRRNAGYFGLILFVVVAAILFVVDANRWFKLILFLPAFIAAIGFLQAKNKFCVGYAASGLQNATEGNTEAQAVEAAARAIDKARARRINLQAAAIALVVTAVSVVI